ncbi:MAG TPA: YciI-like protein [Candidatus Acidoferrum sp.]
MAFYALFYEVVEDFVSRRSAFREEHLRRVSEAYARGELILAGAMADPADRALLVFQTNDKHTVEKFAQEDPYVVNGLVTKWQVRPWSVVTGNEVSRKLNIPAGPREIARIWSARATNEKWSQYREHFAKNVLQELRGVAGYLGATLYVRYVGDEREILVETLWRSLDAIHLFAGVELETAVVAEEAQKVLTEYDRNVRHYEVVLSDRVPGEGTITPR